MQHATMVFPKMKESYERNNRSNQVKALRCFPRCKEGGHTDGGYCGAPITVLLEVPITKHSPPCQRDDNFWASTLFLAEMRCEDKKGLSHERLVQKSLIMPQIRSRNTKTMPYILGRITGIQTVTMPNGFDMVKRISLDFNSEAFAWHYGWTSHKCSSNKLHVIDVMVLVERDASENRLFVSASFLSPGFRITSTKKSKKDLMEQIQQQQEQLGAGQEQLRMECVEEANTPPDGHVSDRQEATESGPPAKSCPDEGLRTPQSGTKGIYISTPPSPSPAPCSPLSRSHCHAGGASCCTPEVGHARGLTRGMRDSTNRFSAENGDFVTRELPTGSIYEL